MYLPTELIEEILSYLPSHDTKSLRSCSLVAKSWLDPCRRRLFESVDISISGGWRWPNNISPKNTGLLRHVRELEYINWHPPCSIGYGLRDYFPSFCQLQHLGLQFMMIEPITPDHMKLFFAFQHTLVSLSLRHILIPWGGIVTLLEYFPNLRGLEIREVTLRMKFPPAPNPICALRGRLSIQYHKQNPKSLIDRFVGLKLEYEELVITGTNEQRLIAAAQDSLKNLRITNRISNLTVDLSGCPELHQLEIDLMQPEEEERTLISSITSTNLRKLVLGIRSMRFGREDFPSFNSYFASLDDTLCGLINRLQMSGYKHTLEVEFRTPIVELDEEVRHEKFLPKFKEKGRVRIMREISRD